MPQPTFKRARSSIVLCHPSLHLSARRIKSSDPFRARTSEELIALLSAVATAILAFIIITTLYFGREIFVPIALAILLSFVLAPLVALHSDFDGLGRRSD
jgi:multisubunit Na+/H+ antiporter MnhF subunit